MDNIKVEQLQSVYADLCNIIGLDFVLRVYSTYKGQQISFPQKLFSNEYISQKIINEYNGSNLKELAKKYDYSERWIREIVKKSDSEES